MMKKVKYADIVRDDLIKNAIINNEFIGFKEDYLIIHSLLSMWKPKTIFEIGTCTGMGCVVMNNATPSSKIITLDINSCGHLCPKNTLKIVGDSLQYDYSKHYPIDCWFIDGNHIYKNAYEETSQAIKSESNYIIYHDADIKEVYDGIVDSFINNNAIDKYDLYQVIDPPFIYSSSGENITRILYAIKKI